MLESNTHFANNRSKSNASHESRKNETFSSSYSSSSLYNSFTSGYHRIIRNIQGSIMPSFGPLPILNTHGMNVTVEKGNLAEFKALAAKAKKDRPARPVRPTKPVKAKTITKPAAITPKVVTNKKAQTVVQKKIVVLPTIAAKPNVVITPTAASNLTKTVIPPIIKPPIIKPPILPAPIIKPKILPPPITKPPVIKLPIVKPPIVSPPAIVTVNLTQTSVEPTPAAASATPISASYLNFYKSLPSGSSNNSGQSIPPTNVTLPKSNPTATGKSNQNLIAIVVPHILNATIA